MLQLPSRLLSLSFGVSLFLTGCGGLLSQAVNVQRAVEAKSYDVEHVHISNNAGQKVVTVHVVGKVDDAAKAEIEETAKTVVPDASVVEIRPPRSKSDAKPTSSSKPAKPSSRKSN